MDAILMTPAPGQRVVRHVGDTVRFTLGTAPGRNPTTGWQARLRTNLGRGRVLRDEIIRAHTAKVPPFGACWHDLPLAWNGTTWSRDLVLAEAGFHAAKGYLLDPRGRQHWPAGPDLGLSVHPDWCRSGNTLYCAFTRLFGPTRFSRRLQPEPEEAVLTGLERHGYATLPPSGTFRDLTRQLPHIVQRLGCRILHLLPVHPTPTVFGRFGRMGSPYAALDLTAVDPSLVEFDRRTTGIDQFCELTRAAHLLDARVFLDIVINHTGWGSRLYEERPEFFRREPDQRFACPGAWGTVWEDLVELEQRDVALWDLIAEALLEWCRRGVDGFRCDAGYKVPTHVWQYIIARVTREFPDTVFLLEGLGGSWEATENLLGEGGMQWAYSELFQNYSGDQVQSYLDYALPRSETAGTYVHYSETHDNERLAARGRDWSLLRNRLCALTSVRGGFGFTTGVEWLAEEKIIVHQRTGLGWDQPGNIVTELAALNRLLAHHPAFFDGARLRRASPPGHPVFALHRTGADGTWPVLVLVNTDLTKPRDFELTADDPAAAVSWSVELLDQPVPRRTRPGPGLCLTVPPATVLCLADRPAPTAGHGTTYRAHRARIAWAVQTATTLLPPEDLALSHPDQAAAALAADPARWLSALSAAVAARPANAESPLDLTELNAGRSRGEPFHRVIVWDPSQARRVTLIPPGWWLLVTDPEPFRARLTHRGESVMAQVVSIQVDSGYAACFSPQNPPRSRDAVLVFERAGKAEALRAPVRFLAESPAASASGLDPDGLVLLTNDRGAMARLRLDFGGVRSKYDCVLGANLHPNLPVDRHVLAKRVRLWLNADGFISPLDRLNLADFEAGPPAVWRFRANAGDARTVELRVEAAMVPDRNATFLRFTRQAADADLDATLIVRVDLEDRSYHAETHRNPGADHHFSQHCQPLPGQAGFRFTPAPDRRLEVQLAPGTFHAEAEWSEHIPHPIEANRGQVGAGDAFSPGWFEIPLAPGQSATLSLDAEPASAPAAPEPGEAGPDPFEAARSRLRRDAERPPHGGDFARRLAAAAGAFVVRRGTGRTVIAGYPWFLDWGRDTLIAARGLLAGGWQREVVEILETFGRFADRGTLPNSIHGDNAANRDTSDAPLWYALAVEEATQAVGPDLLRRRVAPDGPTFLEVLRGLAEGYLAGTPNGIRVDAESGLVWSPSHFTWMDTNHPAGTPREGYPVEIQALWIRALRFLERVDTSRAERWRTLAGNAAASFRRLFWLPRQGWFSDVLLGPAGRRPGACQPDTALRCNGLLAITLGLAEPTHARATVDAAIRHLLVPGAVRSLAPLTVSPPLPIRGPGGNLLNDPLHPYWGSYEGDEDTRRKPAYHNGTAWTWFLPILAEALAVAWDSSPEAVATARALLGSTESLLDAGCLGHLPEILDGDAPHTQRGCDAQAWSITEALRVWLLLNPPTTPT